MANVTNERLEELKGFALLGTISRDEARELRLLTAEREEDIDAYYERQVVAAGGHTRRIIYRGRRGCADHLTGFPWDRLFLVELKKPKTHASKAGAPRIHQTIDADEWRTVGVLKVFLKSRAEIDAWIKRACA